MLRKVVIAQHALEGRAETTILPAPQCLDPVGIAMRTSFEQVFERRFGDETWPRP
ncbi:MAG: hypothetical protein WAS21_31925 [Geminicoccaceae bacterium]